MSWWNTNFSDLASQALKNAQKKIDKVLDIDEGENAPKASATETKTKAKTAEKSEKDKSDFWSTWSGATHTETPPEEESRSAWSMPWGSSYKESTATVEKDSSTTTTADNKTRIAAIVKNEDQTKTTVIEKQKKDDFHQKNRLKRENSGSSQKSQKSTSSTRSLKEKSFEGKKLEPVSNVPHIESQEKVDNWDISSGWQSESLSAWQSEAEKDYLDKQCLGFEEKTSSFKEVNVKDLEEFKQKTDSKEPEFPVESNIEFKDNSPEKSCILTESEIDTTHVNPPVDDLSDNFKTSHISEIQLLKDRGGDNILETSGEASVSINSSLQTEDQSSSLSIVESNQSDYMLYNKGDSDTDMGSSVPNVTDAEQNYELESSSPNQSHKISSTLEESKSEDNTDGDSKVTDECVSDSQRTDDIVLREDPETVDDKEYTREVIGSNSEKVSSSNVKPNIDDGNVLSVSENVMADSAFSNASEDSISENVSSQGSGEAEKEVRDDLSEGMGQGPPMSPSACSSVCSSDNSKLDSSMDTHTSEDTVVDKVPAVDDDEEEEEEDVQMKEESQTQKEDEKDLVGSKSNDSMYSVSSSSSYVKCMIEEAMEDSGKVEDSNSDCHSTGGEKSECSRSTGGHESGDEIDTTTSSDIEIISTPNSNGDCSKIVDLSPLKIALQKTGRIGSPTHRRTDSQSSSSTHSREGQGEQLSPGRDSIEDDGQYMDDRKSSLDEHRLAPVCEESRTNLNNHQNKLLKLQTVPEHSEVQLTQSVNIDTSDSMQKQKVEEMSEVIRVREDKLIKLSKENNDLVEANSILRNQLQQLEEMREAEMADLNKVTEEFTKRIGESDKKANTVIRERDAMKKQIEQMQEEFSKMMRNKELELEQKEEQVAELLQEGEKLSKHQLQSNTIVKKLRMKEKENETLITNQKKKLDEQKVELEHLRKVCESKDDMEKKQTDAINQLNTAVQKQEREMAKLKGELEDAQERVRGLQTALDNSYKEITELNKSNAAQDSRAQETALSVEMQVREELKMTLEKEQYSFKQEKEALIMQIEDLRMSMSRLEKEHCRREDMLRQEISDLQMHLQEDEARNQDLTQSVTSATRPLLRQIENLQSTYAAQSTAWERVEKNLSERLADSQNQLAAVVERERSSNEKVMDINSQLTSFESQNSRLRQDKSQLTAQLEMIKTKVQVLEDAKNNEAAQLEVVKHQMSQDLHEVRKEKVFLETQLDMERTKLEQERKKLNLAQDQISVLEREIQRPVSASSTSPNVMSRQDSAMSEPSMSGSFMQDDNERNNMLSPGGHTFAGLSNKTNLYEALRQSGAVNILENLQSQLKLREGEILQLQSDIQQLERTRESMARELVNLTNKNEELQEQVEELPNVNRKLEDVNQRYNALLQMYGEKVEEADELRLDLHDVKEMYKMQIDHLLAK